MYFSAIKTFNMIRELLHCFIILMNSFFFFQSFAQDYVLDWLKYEVPSPMDPDQGTGSFIQSTDMIVNNAIWTTGKYFGQVAVSAEVTFSCPLIEDHMFLIKRDLNGNLIWGKSVTSNNGLNYGAVLVKSMAIDQDGYIYAAGSCYGDVVFEPDGQAIELSVNQGNFMLPFVSKFDSEGNLIWAKNLTESGNVNVVSLKCFMNGSLVIAGTFTNTVSFSSGGVEESFNSLGSNDVCILTLNSDGELEWVQQIGGQGSDLVRSMTVDSTNSKIIIGGSFEGVIDFNSGNGNGLFTSINETDVWLAVYSSVGEFQWGQVARNMGQATINQVEIDQQGNIYAVGQFSNVLSFSSTPANYINSGDNLTNGFIVKYDTDGNIEWVKNVGKVNSNESASRITISNDLVVVLGTFSYTFDIDPGNSVFQISPIQGNNFLLLLDNQGDFLNAEVIGGYYNEAINSISINTSNELFLCGRAFGNQDLDPGILQYTAPAGQNITLKLKTCEGVQSVDSVFSCGPYVWIDGVTYFSSNTTASFIQPSSQGCDSTVYLNLELVSLNTNLTLNNNTITSLAQNVDFQWYECGEELQAIPGATGPSYTFTNPGQYLVELSTEDCSMLSDCILVGMANEEEKYLFPINLSPNPTSSGFVVSNTNGKSFCMVIYNQYGQIVSGLFNVQEGEYIDMHHLSNGLYYIHFSDENASGQQKIVKM
jgi:hypothetical protein